MKNVVTLFAGLSVASSALAFEPGVFNLNDEPNWQPSPCTDMTMVLTLDEAPTLGMIANFREENIGPCEVFMIGEEKTFVRLYEQPMLGMCGGKVYEGVKNSMSDDGYYEMERVRIEDYRTYTCEIPIAATIVAKFIQGQGAQQKEIIKYSRSN